MAELSAYEAKRRERMAANRALLLSLNIEKLPAKAKKRPQPKSEEPAAPVERRKSARLATVTTRSVVREVRARKAAGRPSKQKKKSKRELQEELVRPLRLPTVDLTHLQYYKKPHRGTQELEVDLATFHMQWLGRQLFPVGRQPPLQGIADSTGAYVEVNISGVVHHWKNVTTLMVTLEQNGVYVNPFQILTDLSSGDMPHTTVLFEWVAQPSWKNGGTAVQRMCRVRRGDSKLITRRHLDNGIVEGEDYDHQVILFLRRSNMGAFVYCGRLGFLGKTPPSSPVEGVSFQWEMLDTDSFDWQTVLRELSSWALVFIDYMARLGISWW